MKNAKKSLALLLALVMILGMGTMGASAAFNDAASINSAYADAVNVMAGMGILAGSDSDGDGKFDFNPTGNVTRAQAAKMITYMILGKDAAERLPAKSMFADVKATDWSAKFVYYLANKKIINGYGNGNFGPNDTVTATQLAKMLLAAVGYGQAEEFVGVGWDVNVFALAVELGLYDGTEAADYDAAATREEAALYVFNAMTTIPLMKYVKEDGYYDYKDAAKSTFATSKYYYAEATGVITATKAGSNTYTALVYDKDPTTAVSLATLYLNIDANSNLVGHKVTVTYSTKTEKDSNYKEYNNAYTIEDLSKEVNTTYAKFSAIYNGIGGSKAKYLPYVANKSVIESFTYWENNIDKTNVINVAKGVTYGEYVTTDFSIANIARDADKMPPVTNVALLGSFILDDAGLIIGFKASDYTFEQVKAVTTTAGSESITLSSTGEIKNSAREDYVVEYDGIAKGDYVSVTKTGEIYTLVKATVVKDVKVNSKSNNFPFNTINGTYNQSGKLMSSSDTIEIGGTYDFYMDKTNSYALVKKVTGGIKNLAYVSYIRYTSTTGSTGTYMCYANCVGTDGTVKEYLITPAQYGELGGPLTVNGVPADANKAIAVNKLYSISTETDSSYYYKQTVAKFSDTDIVAYTQTFNSNYRVAEDRANGSYILANDVEYVYVSTDVDKVPSAPKTVVSISKTKPASTSGDYRIFFYPTRVSSDSVNYDVDQIFIIGSAKAVAGTSYIYSSGDDVITRAQPSKIGETKLNDDNTIDYYLYAFIDKDYVKNIKLSGTTADFTGNTLKPGFYEYTIDTSGYYTLTRYYGTATGDDNRVIDSQKLIGIYNNMITTQATEDPANNVIDLIATDAAIVDFSGYGIKTLDQLNDYLTGEKIRDGKTYKYEIKISLWSYLYDKNKGTDKATTNAIYVNSITEVLK